MRILFTLLFILGFGAPALAGETYREDFTAFFGKAVGEWHLTLQDYDEEGKLTYEGEQVRTFEWGIADRYVEEKAYITRDNGEVVYLGLMLYSLDEESGETLMTSFWPRSPRRWAEFEGQVSEGGEGKLTGILRSYRTDGIERKRRVEIEFSSADEIVFLNFAETEEGKEYLVERLTYKKADGE